MHGYDVQTDLARHYSLTECTFLALTGELPREGTGRMLEVIATFVGPKCVTEAPVHAASLVQLCGAPPRAVVAASAVGLAEQMAALVEAHVPLLAWLEAATGDPPASALGSDADRGPVERLRVALREAPTALPALDHDLSLSAATLVVLFACGLTTRPVLVAFLTWASLPFVAAEALAVRAGHFRDYPVRLPEFDYEEGAR
ncbi:MAG: citrate synthase family protein [Myxococcaceae bacterium]